MAINMFFIIRTDKFNAWLQVTYQGLFLGSIIYCSEHQICCF